MKTSVPTSDPRRELVELLTTALFKRVLAPRLPDPASNQAPVLPVDRARKVRS